MFIGHLPAGYITSKLLYPRFISQNVMSNHFLLAGALGAIAPDLDMVYFYLVDHRQHHHHTYMPHYPIIWVTMLFLSIISFRIPRNPYNSSLAVIFFLNGVIHMLLDSIVGDIWWFAPLAGKQFAFFTVPALYKPWWLNFIFHWSFGLELVVVIWAVYLWRKNAEKTPGQVGVEPS
jgi:hypothetical protein